jgi:hypothetical protein
MTETGTEAETPAVTPGHAAYRAYMTAHPPKIISEAVADALWAGMGDEGRDAWEAAAAAGGGVVTPARAGIVEQDRQRGGGAGRRAGEVTPGRAAYEVMRAESGIDVPWEDLDPSDRELWRAIADAAVMLASLSPSELRTALAETREVREVLGVLLGLFRPTSQGWAARTSGGRLRRFAESAGVMPPDVTTNYGEVPDEAAALAAQLAAMTLERERERSGRLHRAGEADEARSDLRLAVALACEVIGTFGPSSSGHTARVGQVQIARWNDRAEVLAARHSGPRLGQLDRIATGLETPAGGAQESGQ